MANRRHLKILEQGVDTWNKWRSENAEIKPNLRGANLKGKELVGADFNDADIRSTNFTGAILREAKFCQAKAGLKKRWAILLVVASWVLALISGFFLAFVGYWVSLIFDSSSLEDYVVGWVSLIVLVIFFFITLYRGIIPALGAVVFAFAFTFAFAFAFAFADIDLDLVHAIGGDLVHAIGGAIVFAGGVAFAVALAIAFAIAFTLADVAGAFAVALAIVFVFAFAFTGASAKAIAFAFTLAITLLCAYMARHALKGNDKYALIRNITIALAALGGTSFRDADLTDADFTGASLKSTDLRKAILTRTCWRNTKKLDRVRPGETYLRNAQLLQLLIAPDGKGGDGKDKNFEHLDLRGLNLSGANLNNASFIDTDLYQSNLQDTNLSGAILVRTQLERADLTGATLTGACIQDWSVTRTTKLQGVECKYVFMKYVDGDKRDQMPPKGEFKEGEFIFFVRSILDTLDLYHERDVNPGAAVIVLKSLADDYQEPLEIVGLEKRGNGIIIKLKTSEFANQEQLKQEYYSRYSQTLTITMTDPEKILPSHEVLEAKFTELVEDVKKRPTTSTSIKYLYNEGFFITGGTPKVNIDQSKHQSINTGGGNIDARGAVAFNLADTISEVTATFNELPASSKSVKPGIKELLAQLTNAIADSKELDDEDKAEALEQVKKIAEVGKNPTDEGSKRIAKTAIKILRGTAAMLPAGAALVTICKEVLPAIALLFGL